jgi:hypothetical protein
LLKGESVVGGVELLGLPPDVKPFKTDEIRELLSPSSPIVESSVIKAYPSIIGKRLDIDGKIRAPLLALRALVVPGVGSSFAGF